MNIRLYSIFIWTFAVSSLSAGYAYADRSNPGVIEKVGQSKQTFEERPVSGPIYTVDPRKKKEKKNPAYSNGKVKVLNPVKMEDPVKLEKEALLRRLMETMKESPRKLDFFFKYAEVASSIEKYDSAEKAYSHMLRVNPELKRVKLDMALLYMRMARYEDAKKIFTEIKSDKEVPDKVKENIQLMLGTIEKITRRNVVSGSISIGNNMDTNANSASASGEVTYSDTSIALDATSTAARDSSFFYAATVSDVFRFTKPSNEFEVTLDSSGTFYRTDQRDLNSIDIALVSFKTGPQFNLKKYRTKIGTNFIYSYLKLNREPYLITTAAEMTLTHILNDKLSLNMAATVEKRTFRNSPTTFTYTGKTGNAFQTKYGANYLLTPKDLLGVDLTLRSENAKIEHNAKFDKSFSLSHTHQFPFDISTVTSFSFKQSDYDALDSTISTQVIRQDRERTFSFNVGKKLPHNVALTVGYQYKNATSNIQNYTYKDYRLSTALGWTF